MNNKEQLQEEHSVNFIKKSFELKNLKLYKEAIEMLYKALACEDIGHSTNEVISQIGDLYFLLKNFDRAQEHYEKVLEDDKTNSHALFQLCEIYFLQRKYDEALDLIKELCEKSTQSANFIKYFEILYNLNKYDEMKQVYTTLNQEIKENPEIMYLMSLGDNDNKEAFLIKTIEKDKDNIKASYDLGKVYFKDNKTDLAKKCFEFITERKDDPPSFNYLGLIAQRENDFNSAIKYFYKATKLDQTNGEYYLNLARAYMDIHWFDEAQTAIQKSLKIFSFSDEEPDLSRHYYALAWINWQRKNYKNAVLNLDLIKKNSSLYNDAQILRNIVDLELGDLTSAKVKLESLYSKTENQKNPNLISALGVIYKELKMFTKSIQVYEKGIEYYPNSYEFLYELIHVLIEDKNYDYALQVAEKFSSIYPNSADIYNSYARIFYRQKKYNEALLKLKKLTELDQNNAEAFYFMGLILNDLNKPDDAIKNLELALNLGAQNCKYYAQYARSCALKGDYKSALLFIKEAIDIKPEEINYAKTASEYCEKIGDTKGQNFYQNLAQRLEKLLKTGKKN